MDFIDAASGLLIPLFVGVGVALTLSPSVPAEFWAARACFIASGLIALGWGCYWLVTTDMRIGWKMVFACLLGAVCIPILVGLLLWSNFRADLAAPDVLTPGNLPQPPGPSFSQVPLEERPKATDYLVYFGTNVSWFNGFPHTILQLSGVPMLTIDKDKSGNVFIKTLKVFDKNGKIITRVEDNGFWVTGSSRKVRPNKSVLQVFDDEDRQVLSLTLLNRRCIELEGAFYRPGSKSVIITKNYMEVNGDYWSNNLFNTGSNVDIGVQ